MLVTSHARGFTLVELLVGLAVLALLMVLVLPTFTQFLGNTRIRSTAESLANGLRQAQVEALRRNRNIEFEVDPATGWTIRDPDPTLGGIVQQEPYSDTAGTVTVQARPAGALKLTFSPIGQYLNPNPDLTPSIQGILVNSAVAPKRYRVAADPTLGIGIRICDETFTHPPAPDGCSAAAMAL